MITAKVEGLTELRDLLMRKLPDAVQGKALQGALSNAAKPIVKDARTRVPVKTGTVRRGIYSFRSRRSTKGKAVRMIAVRSGKRYGKRDAYYWRWLEFGRGEIVAKPGKSLGSPSRGFFGKKVKAVPARPFLRPAFEARKFEALETFRKTMAFEIDKAAVRLHRQSKARLRRKVFGV